MASPAPPPPRLYAITATAAPVAAVIARTSGWFMVARWNLESGKVEPGAWLLGKIYPRRCDVSPDGKLLYYFAMKGGKPFHAVSWLPWLTALALWRDNSTYTNGGYFRTMTARAAAPTGCFLSHAPDLGDATPLGKQHRLRLVGHDRDAYKVERVRGWREHETCPQRALDDIWDERRHQVLYRTSPVEKTRLVLFDAGITRALGNIELRKPTYRLEQGGAVTELPGVTWADWDKRGRLLVATDRGTLEIRNAETGIVKASHDLTGIRPDPAPSPPRARKW